MMLKQLFALAILSHSVFCRFTPNERQLQIGADQGTGDAWKYCNDTCIVECVDCEKHHECNIETEKKCGEGPERKGENGVPLPECPRDEQCVNIDCFCPVPGNDGKDCPIICEDACQWDTQIVCDAGKDDNGCDIQDLCINKGHNTIDNSVCPGFCPTDCLPHTIECEEVPDNGCPVEPTCQEKTTDNKGKYCDFQQCELVCEDTEHLCHGDEDIKGCEKEDKCVPKQAAPTQPNDVMCPGTCPVDCKDGWIECDGTIDYSGGIHQHCKGQPTCRNKAKDINGQYCEENSASHGCPVTCPPDEVLCPGKMGPLECKEESKCHKRTISNVGEYCPYTSDCSTHCPPNHVNCPGGIENDGCKKPEQCIEEHRDFNGDVCTVHCPETCKDDEVFCPGTRNPITGCFGKDTCEAKGQHTWGPTPGADCPGWCPASCNNHEVLCPSYTDPCNGCPTEEICREAIKNVNGKFCPGKEFTVQEEQEDYRDNLKRRGGYLSASHNCPVYCQEWKGEVQCPVYEDLLGCKPEASCEPRAVKSLNEGGSVKEYCPASSVCPKQCPSKTKLCHYEETDEDGCGHEDVCVDIDTDDSGNLCEQDWCPPLCLAAQIQRDNGDDEVGCKKAPTCA